MRTTKTIHVVSCHAEGEVGDVIVGGVAPPPGDTLWEQRASSRRTRRCATSCSTSRAAGCSATSTCWSRRRIRGRAMGWIIMEPEDTPPMSGSNSICVATVLLDTGIVPMAEPETRLTLEAPGGMVEIMAECRNGKAERITVPSPLLRRQARRQARGRGARHAHRRHRLWRRQLRPRRCARARASRSCADEARELAQTGMKITRAANEQLGFPHPENAGLGPHLVLPVRRAGLQNEEGDRWWSQRRRDPSRQDRPLATRHGLLGAHGRAACAAVS